MTIEQILEAIEQMKVTELNELVKAAEEKFGVSASAPVMVAGAAGGAAAEEKTEFCRRKIRCICFCSSNGCWCCWWSCC